MKYLLTLFVCMALWVLRFYHFMTPNNVLNANKFIDFVFIVDFVVSPIMGIFIFIIVKKNKNNIKSMRLYWANLIAAIGLPLAPLTLLFFTFIAVAFFGLTV